MPDAMTIPQTAMSMRTCNGPSPAKGRPRVSPRNPAANQTESTVACPRRPRTQGVGEKEGSTRIKEDVDGPRPSTGWRVPSCVRGLNVGASTLCCAASSPSHASSSSTRSVFSPVVRRSKRIRTFPVSGLACTLSTPFTWHSRVSTHSTSPAVQPGKWRRTRPGIRLKIRSRQE